MYFGCEGDRPHSQNTQMMLYRLKCIQTGQAQFSEGKILMSPPSHNQCPCAPA